jgi:cell division protein FtsQ
MARRVAGTRRSAMNRRRRGALSVIVPWTRRFGLLLFITCFSAWLGSWLLISNGSAKVGNFAHGRLVSMSASMGFKVENVLVEGRKYADGETIKNLIGAEYGAPLFAFNPEITKQNIEKVEWIKSAEVGRRLPDTIYIKLQEHMPLALWQKDKALYLVDEEGQIINTPHLGRFRDLIIVMGEGAPQNAPALLADLNAEPTIAKDVTSAKWTDGRRWDLELKQGITLKLPERDSGLALSRLAKEERETGILAKDITFIDLREPEKIVVRTRPGALQEYSTKNRAQQASLKAGDNI